MDVKQLEGTDFILLKAIVGSQLYGLATPSSDIDIKGIYKLPLNQLLRRNYQDQVNDERNDQVFYEVGRFLGLAAKANPNTLEVLYSPDEFILKSSEDYKLIRSHRDKFLTKAIRDSLGGYAIAQIKKARGNNKKIVNPIDKIRKTPLEFCYIIQQNNTIPLTRWLSEGAWTQNEFGLSKLNDAHNVYLMYYNEDTYPFRGLVNDSSNELRLSSIPKELVGKERVIYFASENYSNYCKNYAEYWEWMENRNESRYASVEEHKKGYDGKHLMHCFRLLDMGIDAAKYGDLIVKRPNREWLLSVRNGEFDYDDLITQADEKLTEMDELIKKSSLPGKIDEDFIDDLLLEIRGV
jgi:predicted nucleotidyltransferase